MAGYQRPITASNLAVRIFLNEEEQMEAEKIEGDGSKAVYAADTNL